MVEVLIFVLNIKFSMLEYIAIVIGLIAFGDVAFITATYFALFGYLDLGLIILLWCITRKRSRKNRIKSSQSWNN